MTSGETTGTAVGLRVPPGGILPAMARPSRSAPLADRIGLWPARAVWASLPLTFGPALDDLVADASTGVRWWAALGAWALWFAGLLALLVPGPISLTAVRILTPATLVLAVWAIVRDGVATTTIVALVAAVALVVAVFQAATGDAMVNGSAYGSERRLALRAPAALLIGPIPVVWALTVGPIVAGTAWLADQRWLLGGIVSVVGVITAVVGARALHQLARRWLVFVPAGFVIHDRWLLAEPILLRRTSITKLGPAPADHDAVDLTAGAPGLALRAQFDEPIELAMRRKDGPELTPVERVLVSPSLPGRVITEARVRGIKID